MKYALITGASRGIGAATAREFARRGWGVAVNYVQSQAQALHLVTELTGDGSAGHGGTGRRGGPGTGPEDG